MVKGVYMEKENLTREQKLEKRRCYFPGEVITNIEELLKYDLVYCRGRIYNKSWIMNWQFAMVMCLFKNGCFRYAHKKEGYKTSFEKKIEKMFKWKLDPPNLKPYTLEDAKKYLYGEK